MEIFRNSEWVVTDKGIEATAGDPGYWIEIDRGPDTTTRAGIVYYDSPIHLAEKEWVAITLFLEAWVHAIRYHANRTGQKVDEPMLQRTCDRAIAEAHLTQQCRADMLEEDAASGRRERVCRMDDYNQRPAMRRSDECERTLKALYGL